MPEFRRFLMVDWSAANQPTPARPSKDAIHAALYGPEGLEKRYFRTRAACMAWVAALAAEAAQTGERLLSGFDFPFGHPVGGAFAACGRPEALALWDRLAALVEDGEDNRSNRFDVAAQLNAAFPGEGPFWGCPPKAEIPGLPPKKPAPRPGHPPEFRLCERRAQGAPGTNGRAQSVWKLYTAGSVGSQALLGMAALAGLRADPALAGQVQVWPFETGFSAGEAPVVLAEIFPSLWATDIADAAEEEEIKDAAQVRILAEAFAAMDGAGELAALMGPPPGLSETEAWVAEREEGWILGVV